MVILVAEISGGVWAYMNRAELHKMVRETVRNTVQKEYTKDNVTTTTFDMIQQSLQCCGSHDYKSWFGSAFHPGGLGRLDIGVSSQNQNISHVVPESCCVEPGTPECKKARQDVKPEHNPKIIYTEVNSLSFSSSSSSSSSSPPFSLISPSSSVFLPPLSPTPGPTQTPSARWNSIHASHLSLHSLSGRIRQSSSVQSLPVLFFFFAVLSSASTQIASQFQIHQIHHRSTRNFFSYYYYYYHFYLNGFRLCVESEMIPAGTLFSF